MFAELHIHYVISFQAKRINKLPTIVTSCRKLNKRLPVYRQALHDLKLRLYDIRVQLMPLKRLSQNWNWSEGNYNERYVSIIIPSYRFFFSFFLSYRKNCVTVDTISFQFFNDFIVFFFFPRSPENKNKNEMILQPLIIHIWDECHLQWTQFFSFENFISGCSNTLCESLNNKLSSSKTHDPFIIKKKLHYVVT